MLEPAGNAKHTGREIDDCFERGITLQYAEELKKQMQIKYPTIRIILSRFAGENIEPLQNAHFSNRLGVNFYLSIHFYEEQDEKPKFFLYQFAYNSVTDFWEVPHEPLQFVTYDQAHRMHSALSKMYGEHIMKILNKKKYLKQFEPKGFFALPFKPLIGINAPALAFEAGIKQKKDWNLFIDPLIQGLSSIIEQELKAYKLQ